MNILLKILAFAYFCIASVYSYSIGIKALVLHTEEDETFKSVVSTLNSYSIPFDDYIINNTDNVLNGNVPLYDEKDNPKYYLIIITSGKLSSVNHDGSYSSSLTDEQWAYLDNYEKSYGIRRITLNDTPESATGTSIYDPENWGNSYVQDIVGADNDIAKEIYKKAGIKIDAPIATKNNLYHTPVVITNEAIATPIFYFEPCKKVKERTVGGIYAKLEDGRERMSFYLPTATWSLDTLVLNHLWVHWGTRNLYNGIRRVTFCPHIDDVFISTNLVSTTEKYDSSNKISLTSDSYRVSGSDFDAFLKFRDKILKKMPKGSKFKIDLAINGNGLLPPGDQLRVDGERYVEIDYVKPNGEGKKNWPEENYTPKWTDGYLSKDNLYKYFKDKNIRSKFYWCSHTFTHENLDNAATSDVDNEIRVNIYMAKMLNLTEKKYWSGHSIITPQISGLHNGDALRVFTTYNITSATGDISRHDITDDGNPYIPFVTTRQTSNYQGFPIVPRSPTEIYYYASTPEENTFIYNYMYHEYFGTESSWDEILERESTRVLRLMMLLRHDAHQFHQANLRSDESNDNKSLLERWVEAVVKLYNKYADWPLISMKLDDLNKLSTDRLKISKCASNYKINIVDGYATEVIIDTAHQEECILPITVPEDVVRESNSGFKYEQIGNDPLTVWVKVTSSARKVKLNPPIKWVNNLLNDPSNTTPNIPVQEPSTTLEPPTSTKTPPSPTVPVYRLWFDEFFKTDWLTCGNHDYVCKQLQSDHCYVSVNSCWQRVPYPENTEICNEMNNICSKIWTYVKDDEEEEPVNNYEEFFKEDWTSCGINDWTCKTNKSNECYQKAKDCWNQPWSPKVNEICNKMNAVCARIWL